MLFAARCKNAAPNPYWFFILFELLPRCKFVEFILEILDNFLWRARILKQGKCRNEYETFVTKEDIKKVN